MANFTNKADILTASTGGTLVLGNDTWTIDGVVYIIKDVVGTTVVRENVSSAGGGTGDVTTAQLNAAIAALELTIDEIDPERNIGPLEGYVAADSPVTALTGEAGDWVYLKDAVTYGGTAYPAGTVLKLNVDSDDGAGDITDWVIEEALSKAMTAASNEDDIRLYMAGNTSSTVWQYIGTGVNRFFTMFTAKDGATATQIANTDPNSVNGAIVWDWGGSNLLHHHNTELAALGYYSDTSVVWFLGAIYTAVAGGDHTQSPSTATDVNWKRHASGQFENAKNSAQTVDTTDVDRKLIVAHNLTAGTITAGSFGKVIEFVATVDMQVVAGAGVTLEFRASGGLNFEAHQSGALVATAANTWAVIGGNA